MNKQLNDIKINPEFSDLFSFKSDKERIEHYAQMISFRILSVVEQLCDEKGIKKKDLASLVGSSRSYITQLFTGTKFVNTAIMAKFEDVLNMRFEFNVKLKEDDCENYSGELSTRLFANAKLNSDRVKIFKFPGDTNDKEFLKNLKTGDPKSQMAA